MDNELRTLLVEDSASDVQLSAIEPQELHTSLDDHPIIGLAHTFDKSTVAEGIEDQSQLDYLMREGCDESRGYLHCRPLPRSESEGWLTRFGSRKTVTPRSAMHLR